MMRAIVLREFGPAENLLYEEVEDPEPGPGQVRIAVAAAGVHLIDTIIRRGVDHGPYPQPVLPAIPGREVAGVVDALGSGVDESWLGRRVVAHLGQASAGYAERAVREVEALHALPDGLTDETAVAMIGTGRTTMAILDVAQITADDVVLITAAAGGIGSLLVQAARASGANVIGAAGGPEKVAHVRALGADLAIDYSAPDWTDAIGEVTVALDGVGGEIGRAAFDALGAGGRLIVFGGASGGPIQFDVWELYRRGLTVSAAIGRPLRNQRALEERALGAAAEGRLIPAVQRFPLADAATAHAAIEARATIGKVVLIP